eukprot:1930615-Rhodomonas_salina.3
MNQSKGMGEREKSAHCRIRTKVQEDVTAVTAKASTGNHNMWAENAGFGSDCIRTKVSRKINSAESGREEEGGVGMRSKRMAGLEGARKEKWRKSSNGGKGKEDADTCPCEQVARWCSRTCGDPGSTTPCSAPGIADRT